MTTNPEVLPLPQDAPAPSQPTASALQPPEMSHRGNGRIARLPKALRDQINEWLLDGFSYPEIIQRLGDRGEDLKPAHLTEYRKRGYEDWLRQREWFERVTAKAEFSKELLSTPDATKLHEAGLRVAAAQMLDQLMRFNAGVGTEDSEARPDPEQFARLVNALSRLTREALSLQKYQDACAKAQQAMQPLKDPHRKLTDSETRAIVAKVDQILGIKPISVLVQEYNRRKTDDGSVPCNDGLQKKDRNYEPSAIIHQP